MLFKVIMEHDLFSVLGFLLFELVKGILELAARLWTYANIHKSQQNRKLSLVRIEN